MSETIKEISPKDFWGKIARVPKVAGCEIVEKAVTLYVLLTEGEVPWWLRGSILACLAYFLWPLDAIPDYLPGGYLDDLAAMVLLLADLHVYVTPSLRQRVQDLLPEKCKRREPWLS